MCVVFSNFLIPPWTPLLCEKSHTFFSSPNLIGWKWRVYYNHTCHKWLQYVTTFIFTVWHLLKWNHITGLPYYRMSNFSISFIFDRFLICGLYSWKRRNRKWQEKAVLKSANTSFANYLNPGGNICNRPQQNSYLFTFSKSLLNLKFLL